MSTLAEMAQIVLNSALSMHVYGRSLMFEMPLLIYQIQLPLHFGRVCIFRMDVLQEGIPEVKVMNQSIKTTITDVIVC